MFRVVPCFVIVFLLALLSACDDSPECPTQYAVHVFIKNKNYFNVESVSQLERTDENLPFRHFVGAIYYSLRNKETNALVRESSITPVESGESSYTITFDNIPSGEYELTVWGNVTTDVPIGYLHNNEQEHTDIYIASKSLTFSYEPQSAEIMMERAKGLLLLICKNFPSAITSADASVSSLYQTVDPHWVYGGNTRVAKTFSIQPLNMLFVAPTVNGQTSKLNLRFYSGTNADAITLPEMNLPVRRNEISAIEVDYNTISKTLDISILINGEWTTIHHLDIENLSM